MLREDKEALVFALDSLTADRDPFTDEEREYMIKLIENDLNG